MSSMLLIDSFVFPVLQKVISSGKTGKVNPSWEVLALPNMMMMCTWCEPDVCNDDVMMMMWWWWWDDNNLAKYWAHLPPPSSSSPSLQGWLPGLDDQHHNMVTNMHVIPNMMSFIKHIYILDIVLQLNLTFKLKLNLKLWWEMWKFCFVDHGSCELILEEFES